MRRHTKFCCRSFCLGLARCGGMLAFGLRTGPLI